jgi:GNAT superfamily N-acetyltransferase
VSRAFLRFTLTSLLIIAGCATSQPAPTEISTRDVRRATHADLNAIERLAELRRRQYESHHPPMWRNATDAWHKHMEMLREKIRNADSIILVHESGQDIDGFLIADFVTAPPVYDPGGLTCRIDDFVVDPPARWSTAGQALLSETRRQAAQVGCVQVIVVCGEHDQPKRRLLRGAGLSVASEWYVDRLP